MPKANDDLELGAAPVPEPEPAPEPEPEPVPDPETPAARLKRLITYVGQSHGFDKIPALENVVRELAQQFAEKGRANG